MKNSAVALGVVLVLFGAGTAYPQSDSAAQFATKAEATGYAETATYDETIANLRKLEQASDLIKLFPIGTTPQGRTMYLAVVSKDRAFTPELAAAAGKVIVLVQSGIHAGEIDGKEATLALLRDMLIAKKRAALLDNVILLVVPVFNVDGHENASPYNRVNQIGPAKMGVRTTAQGYDLNRDFIKADAPEMKNWIRMFVAWRPHLLIDNHITDGADFQYAITYTISQHQNAPATVREWATTRFMPALTERLRRMGQEICPYVMFRGNDPTTGLRTYVDIGRFSTGYAAVHNRPGLLVEMHMLKDFRTRVQGNYDLMVAALEELNAHPQSLIDAVRKAEAETITGLTEAYPLRFRPANDSILIDFLGYQFENTQSEIAGTKWTQYDPQRPVTYRIPYFYKQTVADSVFVPRYYLIPQEWQEEIARLALHGVRLERLTGPLTADVEMYRLTEPKWDPSSYAGRVRVSFKSETQTRTRTFPAGTIVVSTRQRDAKAAVQLLEPKGPDSFVSWGFMNTVFERKNYIEDFAAERLATQMLADDPQLGTEFEARLAADSTFRNSPYQRWLFFFDRSPYGEQDLYLYPIARLLNNVPMKTEPYIP